MTRFTFASFPTKAHALELTDILDSKIPYELETDENPLSDYYIGQISTLSVHVKIDAQNFEKARQLWETAIENSEQLDVPDFMKDFNVEELTEIIETSDKWSVYHQIVAKKLLLKQGINLDENDLKKAKIIRLQELQKPEKAKLGLLIIGYFSPAISVISYLLIDNPIFYITFIGAAIGLFLLLQKKTLPNGDRVHVFTSRSRMHGLILTLFYGTIIIIRICYFLFS